MILLDNASTLCKVLFVSLHQVKLISLLLSFLKVVSCVSAECESPGNLNIDRSLSPTSDLVIQNFHEMSPRILLKGGRGLLGASVAASLLLESMLVLPTL